MNGDVAPAVAKSTASLVAGAVVCSLVTEPCVCVCVCVCVCECVFVSLSFSSSLSFSLLSVCHTHTHTHTLGCVSLLQCTVNIVFDRVGKVDPVTRGIEIAVNWLGIQFDVSAKTTGTVEVRTCERRVGWALFWGRGIVRRCAWIRWRVRSMD